MAGNISLTKINAVHSTSYLPRYPELKCLHHACNVALSVSGVVAVLAALPIMSLLHHAPTRAQATVLLQQHVGASGTFPDRHTRYAAVIVGEACI
jgi:hypothetical protein